LKIEWKRVVSVEGLREKKSLFGFLYFRDRKVCVVSVSKVMKGVSGWFVLEYYKRRKKVRVLLLRDCDFDRTTSATNTFQLFFYYFISIFIFSGGKIRQQVYYNFFSLFLIF
jgi:hypothetical protein